MDHKNKESLGPGSYSIVKNNPNKVFKIPNMDRGLLNNERNNSPSPASYNTDGLENRKARLFQNIEG